MKYPLYSKWRKWDLHVHTPASAGYKGTYDQVVDQIIRSEAEVIGINDYFTIAGYKEIKSRLAGSNAKHILPVVEMRMNNVLANRHSDSSGVRINFHIIFNPYDEIEKRDLIPSIESFIKSIKYKTLSGQDAQIATIYDDREALLNQVSVDYDSIVNELEKLLPNNYLIWLPYDEYGGIDGIKSTNFPFKPALINRAHIIGSSNTEEIKYFLGESNDYSKYFDKAKPCIKGSDSHDHQYPLGKLKDKESNPVNKYCWIKADPTFEGLKQIVREPKHRVCIEEIPPKIKLVENNKTKYVQAVTIGKVADSTTKDIWFNNEIEFSSDLVAIIGNKGKGKSALAEILGLLGNSMNYKYFSFLNEDKFKKNKLASNFEANIRWQARNDESLVNLMDCPDPLKVERIKCIPQNYLEILCNNMEKMFQDEIDNVIFSHLDESERGEGTSLNELISYKTQIVEDQIVKIQDNIIKKNDEIIGLESLLKPEHSKQLKEKLGQIINELNSCCEIKPNRPISIDDQALEDKQKELHDRLSNLNDGIKSIETDINGKKQELLIVNGKIGKAMIVQGKIEAFEKGYKDLATGLKADLNILLGIELGQLVNLDINYKKIRALLSSLERDKKDLDCLLDIDYSNDGRINTHKRKGSLYKKLDDKKALKKKLQDQLDEPAKKYQQYLDDLKVWKQTFYSKNAEKRELKKELKRIEHNVPLILKAEQSMREALMKDLFALIGKKVEVYEGLYHPVIKFIQQERSKNIYMELGFSAEIMLSPDFDAKFFSYIDRGKKGSFQGINESQELLKEIKQKYDFSKSNEVLKFVGEIINKLHVEISDGKTISRVLGNQLAQGKSVSSLYGYLYLFRFLKIDYRLKWGDKLLEELSPGERGAVLLIFYLLIDKSDVPLIIDQPEENLDNESIYYLLVRYIKEAKNRRQIFIVTHNPNLAVVCDAEQIIYCGLDKKANNKVGYEVGSIENLQIRKRIIDILEGTKPAFTNRQDKYELD